MTDETDGLPALQHCFLIFYEVETGGVFENIMDTLREKLRISLGSPPSLAIIDSKNTKTIQHVDQEAA
jgi:hypothetical protein